MGSAFDSGLCGRWSFSGAARAVFTLALLANVPVKVLLGKMDSLVGAGLLLVMSLVCFLISNVVWHAALRRYASASS